MASSKSTRRSTERRNEVGEEKVVELVDGVVFGRIPYRLIFPGTDRANSGT
jgi:hypothetical protein